MTTPHPESRFSSPWFSMFEAINTFRKRLADGDLLIGPGIYLTDPRSSEALADSCDYLWVELEHNALGLTDLNGHLIAGRARQTPVLVRIRRNDGADVKPVLDAGADGVVLPQIRSPEEVDRLVQDCRYPPVGRRGFGPLVPTNYGRADISDYVQQANASVFVSVMLETREALEAIDEIVRVPGLDSIVLGPWDLSGSLGFLGQVDHPTVVSAMEKAIGTARDAGLVVGSGMGINLEFAAKQVSRGVQWLQIGSDVDYLVYAMDRIGEDIRERLQ